MKTPLVLLGLLLLLLPACSNDEDPVAPPVVPATTIDAVLAEAGTVAPLAPERDDITTREEVHGDYRYCYETHDAVENLENVVCLGLNDDVIWPGSLVRGDQVYSYVYEPIIVPRAPLTLSISLEGSGGAGAGLVEHVNAPALSTVRQGISNLVGRALESNVTAPAQVDWSYQQVYSASQMSLFVDADISYGAGNLSSSFDWNESSTTTKVVAKYTQVYYSIDMDTPADPTAVLGSGITEEQVRTAFPVGSRPVYVASVKYGMMAIMCIESEFSMSQMQLALDASYSGAVDVDLGFGYTAAQVMQQSSIRIIVYGGATSGIHELNGFDGFMSILSASHEFSATSPGVPLLYKFRHLRNNTLAMISLTSQYTICRPLRIRQGVRISCDRFVCEWSHDDDPFYDYDVDIDRLYVQCNAFDRLNASDAGVQINPVNQYVYNWSTPDYYEMHAGSIFMAGGSIDLLFNTEDYDFNYARIRLNAGARDYDWASGNEWADGSVEILGSNMFGAKSIVMYGQDFRMRAELNIQPIN
jgi:hypothetical protein